MDTNTTPGTKAGAGPVQTLVRDLRWAVAHDPVVAAIARSGWNSERCIVALVEQKQELVRRLMELEAIAPRRVIVDGNAFIWRCPDELVP